MKYEELPDFNELVNIDDVLMILDILYDTADKNWLKAARAGEFDETLELAIYKKRLMIDTFKIIEGLEKEKNEEPDFDFENDELGF